jgi:hypothetical protein
MAAALLVSGCTALPGGARIEGKGPFVATDPFHGLIPATTDAPTQSKTRYIFVIHGMGETKEDYSERLLKAIADLHYEPSKIPAPSGWREVALPQAYKVKGDALNCPDDVLTPPCRYTTFGKYRFDRFEAGSGADTRKVIVVTYYWDAAMAALQTPFLARDLHDHGSAAINTGLKHKVIDLGFGDATAYLGEGGGLARQGIEGAVCAMLKDAAMRPLPASDASHCRFSDITEEDAAAFKAIEYSFVSFSLGSRMLFDVLSGVQSASSAPGETTARIGLAVRTRNFFMLANQMPLLGIGRVSVTPVKAAPSATSDQGPSFVPGVSAPQAGCGGDFFSRAGCRRGDNATSDSAGVTPIADGLEVIAFHDPEDLLGFRASGGMAGMGSTRFTEVRNRNAVVWLWLFANPADAHAAELEHTTARNLILCGATSNTKGRLKPRSCVGG